MELTLRDFIIALSVHLIFIGLVAILNPFKIKLHRDFDAVAVNVLTMPPLGNPELIKGEQPEVKIPEAIVEEQEAVPIESKTESVKEKKKVEEPKPKPKPKEDEGYKGDVRKGETEQKGGQDVSDQLGAGTKFGAINVDNANFNYPYYFVQAFGKIERNWSNPVAANQPLSCVIYFQVVRTGTLLDPYIEKSSGVPAYDRACLRAVQTSNPLPPLPDDFRDDIIGIHLEFPYKPR